MLPMKLRYGAFCRLGVFQAAVQSLRAHNLADFDNSARPTNDLRYKTAFSCTVVTIVHEKYGATMQLNAGEKMMSKGQKSNKETKKLPAMTAKEKKAAKKAKKNQRGRIGE